MTPVPAADRAALGDLVARYALYVDQRDHDAVAGLFTEDGVLVLPDLPTSMLPTVVHRGRAAVRAAMASTARVPRTFHALLGEVYDAGEDSSRAHGAVACAAHHLTERAPGEVVDRVWHLRYRDDYVRRGDGWAIARRELHLATVELRPVRSWLGARG
jgi:ketosteroid isomerase-like protein